MFQLMVMELRCSFESSLNKVRLLNVAVISCDLPELYLGQLQLQVEM